ncbi:MAG TPA: divalent-cation tolerance protein CutA [Longimicrobiales bacterium]|nr:divalent-cation tolerance protein CutA [Longimicrobiales bacterium]
MTRPVAACVVLVTTPVVADAERIVQALVEERLAACGNIVPAVSSIFTWQGALERSAEVLVLLKTSQALLPALTARVVEMHPYELPEILAVPVLGGLDAYLEWIEASTGPVPTGEEVD